MVKMCCVCLCVCVWQKIFLRKCFCCLVLCTCNIESLGFSYSYETCIKIWKWDQTEIKMVFVFLHFFFSLRYGLPSINGWAWSLVDYNMLFLLCIRIMPDLTCARHCFNPLFFFIYFSYVMRIPYYEFVCCYYWWCCWCAFEKVSTQQLYLLNMKRP